MSDRCPVLILGGGVTGLTVAAGFGRRATVLEAASHPGGLCLSATNQGFTFDRGGHVLHFGPGRAGDLIEELLAGELLRQERVATVRLAGHEVPYPFQCHLGDLPPQMARECREGLLSRADPAPEGGSPPRDLASWMDRSFGPGIVSRFLEPFNRKFWGVPLEQLDADWGRRMIPEPTAHSGSNARFHYPLVGGIGALPRALVQRVADLRIHHRVMGIDPARREVICTGGEKLGYETLVSTIPLPKLVRLIQGIQPAGEPEAAARSLRWIGVQLWNLGLPVREVPERHWIYFPDPEVSFYRISFPSRLAGGMAPPGMGSLCIEISLPSDEPKQTPAWEDHRERLLADLEQVGLFSEAGGITFLHAEQEEQAYPLPGIGCRDAVASIRSELRRLGVHSIGRLGAWEHQSIAQGMEQALELLDELGGRV